MKNIQVITIERLKIVRFLVNELNDFTAPEVAEVVGTTNAFTKGYLNKLVDAEYLDSFYPLIEGGHDGVGKPPLHFKIINKDGLRDLLPDL